MSADNWAPCPRCHARMVTDLSAEEKKAKASYGKVSAEKYAELTEDLRCLRERETPQTFREDYEIGIAGAEFYVNYSGSCKTCGLSYIFSTQNVIPGIIE